MKEKLKQIVKFVTEKSHLTAILIVLMLINLVQLNYSLGNFDILEGRDSSLISEVGELKGDFQNLGEDLNEIRKFLRLPTESYVKSEDIDEDEEGKNTDQLQLAIFQYIDQLSLEKDRQKNTDKNQSFLSELFNDVEWQEFLSAGGLEMRENEIYDEDEKVISSYKIAEDSGQLYRETLSEENKIDVENYSVFKAGEIQFLQENKKKIQDHLANVELLNEQIQTLVVADSTVKILDELQIRIDENNRVLNFVGDPIGEIFVDEKEAKVNLVDLNNGDNSKKVENLSESWEGYLRALDSQTKTEKKVKDALESLKKTLNDKGFKILLEAASLQISAEPKEDEDRLYYEIMDLEGNVLSWIVLEKRTGVINVTDADGTNSQNILFFDEEFKKKTLEIPEYIPSYGDEALESDGTFNILVAGKHGSLVDTMIFVHIDENERKIRMISIPRDLYYNGRKINALAASYGMPELKRVLSEISGYKLDKYVLVDMYAFIDVIDLIGGIDITLEKAVVDPFYRTVDNGVEGTLNYQPGSYHLGGVEALRLARSRKTSSDFDRAERQQKILEAIQDKAQNFGFGDADTIYDIARVVLSKVETDVELDEALAYYFRYQNYEIVSNAVMSSRNVLEVPAYANQSDCEAKLAAGEEVSQECAEGRFAYTLMPRDGNWDVIKWFFRQEFE